MYKTNEYGELKFSSKELLKVYEGEEGTRTLIEGIRGGEFEFIGSGISKVAYLMKLVDQKLIVKISKESLDGRIRPIDRRDKFDVQMLNEIALYLDYIIDDGYKNCVPIKYMYDEENEVTIEEFVPNLISYREASSLNNSLRLVSLLEEYGIEEKNIEVSSESIRLADDFIMEYGIHDLHDENCGFTEDGRFVVLDYSLCDIAEGLILEDNGCCYSRYNTTYRYASPNSFCSFSCYECMHRYCPFGYATRYYYRSKKRRYEENNYYSL